MFQLVLDILITGAVLYVLWKKVFWPILKSPKIQNKSKGA